VRGPYPDAVWSKNIISNTTGGDMPQSGYTTADVEESQFNKIPAGDSIKYPELPKGNRPLTIADVGPLAP
jgi:hypothetical protein